MKLSYTRRAKTDLSEIFDYVAQDNAHAAARIITKIRNSLTELTAPANWLSRIPLTSSHTEYVEMKFRCLPLSMLHDFGRIIYKTSSLDKTCVIQGFVTPITPVFRYASYRLRV